jgi:replicative superfamily II helicase
MPTEGDGFNLYDVLRCPLCGKELVEGEDGNSFVCIDFPHCNYRTRLINEEKYLFNFSHNLIKLPSLSFKKKRIRDKKLIEADRFKYGSFNIKRFNALQSEVFRYIDKDENLVIKAPTSSGKTIVAEMFIMKAFSEGKKAIYLSPFKAISFEKYVEWRERFGDSKVALLTGDTRFLDRRKELVEKSLLVMTIELLYYRLIEYREELDRDWILSIGVIVIDEAHILYVDGRGNQLEALLMEILALNSDIRIVLLSATISKLFSLKRWLSALNKKNTRIITVRGRPTNLRTYLLVIPSTKRNDIRYLLEIVRQIGIERKILIFVSSKRLGYDIKSYFLGKGVLCDFHNRDLGMEEREKLEKMFLKGKLNVLVATTTLAWGVNLPAEVVIIFRIKREGSFLDMMDIIQMIGRAGRTEFGKDGIAYIISYEKEKEEVKRYLSSGIKPASFLSKNIDFHILALIRRYNSVNEDFIRKWYKRSYGRFLGIKVNIMEIRERLERLCDMKILIKDRGDFFLSKYGSFVIRCFFPPDVVFYMVEAMQHYVNYERNLDELAISYFLAFKYMDEDVPTPRGKYAQAIYDFIKYYNLRYTRGIVYFGGIIYGLFFGKINEELPKNIMDEILEYKEYAKNCILSLWKEVTFSL